MLPPRSKRGERQDVIMQLLACYFLGDFLRDADFTAAVADALMRTCASGDGFAGSLPDAEGVEEVREKHSGYFALAQLSA